MPRLLLLLALGGLLLAPAARAQQAQPSAAEAKLREGLRNTMLQLRTIQAERDQLIVDKTLLEGEKKDLTEKLEALTKQAAANQAAAQQATAALEAKIAIRETEAAQLTTSLGKWQAAQKEAAALAAKKESERATTAARVIELDRQVADQQRKNAAMFKIGNEVLHRYEKFVLGDALVAREPFTGIARVKFQTLVQDFQDQLTDERIKPSPAKSGAEKSDAKPAAAAPADAPKPPAKATATPAPKGPKLAEQKAKS
jgi:hypothetical protein